MRGIHTSLFPGNFRRRFMKGLTALLPTVVTIALVFWLFNWINLHIATPITDLIIDFLPDRLAQMYLTEDPLDDVLRYGTPIEELHPQTGRRLTMEYQVVTHPSCNSADPEIRAGARHRRATALWHIVFAKWRLNFIGFLIAIVIVYSVGYFISGFLGRTTLRLLESMLFKVPLIRSVYPNIKQVTDFLLGDRQFEFAGVVAAQYPRLGVWSVGLITGAAMKSIADRAGQEMVTIFIPSSPTPVTGYTVTLARSEVIELALSIDEALRFTISGGVIKPPAEGGRPDMALDPPDRQGKLLDSKNNNH